MGCGAVCVCNGSQANAEVVYFTDGSRALVKARDSDTQPEQDAWMELLDGVDDWTGDAQPRLC